MVTDQTLLLSTQQHRRPKPNEIHRVSRSSSDCANDDDDAVSFPIQTAARRRKWNWKLFLIFFPSSSCFYRNLKVVPLCRYYVCIKYHGLEQFIRRRLFDRTSLKSLKKNNFPYVMIQLRGRFYIEILLLSWSSGWRRDRECVGGGMTDCLNKTTPSDRVAKHRTTTTSTAP